MGPSKTYRVCGYQQITSLSTAQALTIPLRDPDGTSCKPNAVILQATGQNVRWRADGTAPTATVGMLIVSTAEQPLYIDAAIDRLRFIETAASAVLNITYLEDVSQI